MGVKEESKDNPSLDSEGLSLSEDCRKNKGRFSGKKKALGGGS